MILASPNYFKSFYIVDSNIDDNLIANALETAQQVEIQSLIGTKLLQTLTSKAETNTLTPFEQEFLKEYLRPTLVRFGAVHLAFLLNNRFTAQGVINKETDSSNPVDWRVVQDELRNIAEFYAQRMLRYILANLNQFPDFFKIDDISQMRSRLTSYSIGWHLRKNRRINGLDTDRGVFSKCF
ncbi:MAG: hypothetical protein QXF76_02765 [Candidatus Anstonellales archaeon]